MHPVPSHPVGARTERLSDLDLELVTGGKTLLANALVGPKIRPLGNQLGTQLGADLGRSLAS